MYWKKLIIVTIAILSTSFAYTQNNLTAFFSPGYISHFGNGYNLEAGIDYEIVRFLDVAVNYRHAKTFAHEVDEVNMSNISAFISWIALNKNDHRLMLGPGIHYGTYERYSSWDEGTWHKEYSSYTIDYVKVRYDYSINERISIGSMASIFGDDGDGSLSAGLVVGYRLF
ncbi:MAG: hypothetical protein K9H65_03010 [Bacteroidales bacterium]|nr:hypothetical protein [Bacteroidales bacterium]